MNYGSGQAQLHQHNPSDRRAAGMLDAGIGVGIRGVAGRALHGAASYARGNALQVYVIRVQRL